MQFKFIVITGVLGISLVISGINAQRKLSNPCKHNQFRCAGGSKCLTSEKLCNRIKDCPQGEDETGSRQWDCSRSTLSTKCDPVNEFKCRYGGCISRDRICDGEPDCWGGNDEATDVCVERVTTTPRTRIVAIITRDPLQQQISSDSNRLPTSPIPTRRSKPPPRIPVASSNPPTRTTRPPPPPPTPPVAPQYPPGGSGCPPIMENDSRGYKVQCKDPFGQTTDCSNFLPTNSRATYRCKDFYQPPRNAIRQTERVCQADGQWSRKRTEFVCYVECGYGGQETTGLIVGGTTSKKGKWPWHVALYHESPPKSGKYEFFCGGSLINDQTVLTAAHCVAKPSESTKRDPREIRVLLGKFYRSYNTRDLLVQERYVREIELNDNYNHIMLQDDIALLWLDRPVQISERVRPVCLPNRDGSDVSDGMLGQLVGWGRTANGFVEDLMETKIPVVRSKDCRDSHQTFVSLLRKSTFCAGYTNGTSACDGDSGGGLVFPESFDRKHWGIQGIVSAGISKAGGSGGCEPKYYSVFTKVSEYLDWIETQIDRFRSLR